MMSSTCKHCGEPISLTETYWVHVRTDLVGCAQGDTQAQPKGRAS